jgi:hypothetical protein
LETDPDPEVQKGFNFARKSHLNLEVVLFRVSDPHLFIDDPDPGF